MDGVSTFCCVPLKKTDFYTNFYKNERVELVLYTWTSWHKPCII